MLATTSCPDAGRRLRAERERLRLSTRDVERMSQAIALKRNDSDYYISHTWVADVEAGKFKPKLYKLHSLSLIYQRSLDEILGFFGLDVRQIGQEQGLVDLPRTCLVPSPAINANGTITAPLGLRDNVGLEQTNLVSRMFERWGEVPIGLLQKTDWRTSLYGYIGLEDYTLYPIIRPGSLVQIDSVRRRSRRIGKTNLIARFTSSICVTRICAAGAKSMVISLFLFPLLNREGRRNTCAIQETPMSLDG